MAISSGGLAVCMGHRSRHRVLERECTQIGCGCITDIGRDRCRAARCCALSDEPTEVAVLDAAAPFDEPCVSRPVRDGMVGLEDRNKGSALAQDAAKRINPMT